MFNVIGMAIAYWKKLCIYVIPDIYLDLPCLTSLHQSDGGQNQPKAPVDFRCLKKDKNLHISILEKQRAYYSWIHVFQISIIKSKDRV